MIWTVFVKLAAGILADRLLGEPRRWHPLVGFGRWATWLDNRIRGKGRSRAGGLAAWALAVGPWLAAAWWLRTSTVLPGGHWIVDIGLLYFAIGARSLTEHGEAVAAPLEAGDLEGARQRVGWMVSRDTSSLDETGVARAACESVLENGNDAVFGTVFWFCVLGGPGALLFRLANTLDAMWGYRNERFRYFGWAAARIDDVLNWLPARATALTYAALGHWRQARQCWREQAPRWDSPNAGPVMASGAGALGIQLGGPAIYHGQLETRPTLGCGQPPDARAVRRAIRLVRHGLWLWLGLAALLAMASQPWR